MKRSPLPIRIVALALVLAAAFGCTACLNEVGGRHLSELEARQLACGLIVAAYEREGGVIVKWDSEQFLSVEKKGGRWHLVGLSQRSHPVVSFNLDGSDPSVQIVWWRR